MQDLSPFHLVPELEDIARHFLESYPESAVIDGKRDRAGQADRMAGLVVADETKHLGKPLPRNLTRWGIATLTGTYLPSNVLDSIVLGIRLRPDVTSRKGLTDVIFGKMAQFGDEELGKISQHLSGSAMDLKRFPDPKLALGGPRWLAACAWLRSHPRLKVLFQESGLPRLHASLRH